LTIDFDGTFVEQEPGTERHAGLLDQTQKAVRPQSHHSRQVPQYEIVRTWLCSTAIEKIGFVNNDFF